MATLDFIREILTRLKPEMQRRYAVSTIGIFGSVVRDDFSSDSDVDLIVDFSKPVGMEFIELADFIDAKLGRSVDLVSRRGIKSKYLDQIEKEIIYV
jgi:predicted nucleotidyltransferase